MEPIRILHIVPNMQQGGIENLIMNMYRNIDRSKIQFDFLVHYQKKFFFDDEIEKLGGKIYRCSIREDNNILKYYYDLNNFFKEHKEYNVVHGHMASLAYIYLAIAKKNGINIRIIHSHGTSYLKSFKGYLKFIMFKFADKNANIRYACSSEAGEYLYGKKKFEIIPNAIDTNKFKFCNETRIQYRKKLNIKENDFVIGHVGRFNAQKNHRFMINMFYQYQKNHENSVLLLIGDGELIDKEKNLCKELNISDKVIFLGNVSNSCDYYNVMDLFLLPSLFEGLPVVGIEAQANGLNCIFSKNITNEVKLTELVEYIELNEKKWINKIEEKNKNRNLISRNQYYKFINESDFDIKKLANNMEIKYKEFFYGKN